MDKKSEQKGKMISYCCKYTPLELLEAFGCSPILLDAEALDFEEAEKLTHANLCSHAKALIQQGLKTEGLILTDCCDSVRRSGDILRTQENLQFFHFMELPHENGNCAIRRMKKELLKLLKAYENYCGTPFSRSLFLEACKKQTSPLQDCHTPWLGVLGARIPPTVLRQIQNSFPLPIINLTCSGNRNLQAPPVDAESMPLETLMEWYAGALLRMTPCMRMTDVNSRRSLTEHPQLKGIIYNTVKFCDYYGFDYASLKTTTHVPILKIETDYTPQPAGQLKTRLEAFAESLGMTAKSHNAPEHPKASGTICKTRLFAGIDSGSTTTNMVVIDEAKNILASAIVRTGAKAQNGADAALDAVLRELSIRPSMLTAIYATGYGRNNIPFATGVKTEITCHAKGAYYLNPSVRTIIDIGGQDSKVICLDEAGAVTQFLMNDKCAAGTGRFLEMMARTLELDIEEMGRKGLVWKNELTISSMCTVFAESEVISLIADNHSAEDIIHGLNKSIAARTASMVSRSKGCGPYMMTGGVARNAGVVQELESKLKESLFIAKSPDLCGALGAALFALEEKEPHFWTNSLECPKM